MKIVTRAAIAPIAVGILAVAAHGHASEWSDVAEPTAGPARVIGSSSGACLHGAVPIPPEGPGYQAVDLRRRRYFGHPELVSYLTDLGRGADEAQLGTMLVGDMAQPRGGPMSYGHVSHQTGLDVDVWYRLDVGPLPRDEREGLEEIGFVDARTGRVDESRWTDRHAELVHLAARDPRVTRVFVDAAIKRDLCDREWDERSWLRKLRPYPRHDDHMHVRLRCPAGSPDCVDQREPPPGEGCGAIANPPESRLPHRPRPGAVPAACRALLEDRGDA